MIAQNARDRAARGRSYRSPKDAGQVNATRVDPTTADEPPRRGGVSVATPGVRCVPSPIRAVTLRPLLRPVDCPAW
jgi:hypothetical protein